MWQFFALLKYWRGRVRRITSRFVKPGGLLSEWLWSDGYATWAQTAASRNSFRCTDSRGSGPPTFSLFMLVREPDRRLFERALHSLQQQTFPGWELWLCTEERSEETRALCRDAETVDLRFRSMGIADKVSDPHTLSTAIENSSGGYVAFLGQHDQLAPEALEIVERYLDKDKWDVVYTDEDRIDPDGIHRDPFFKPDWSPDLSMSRPYACCLAVYRRNLFDLVGTLQNSFHCDVEYDLALRCSEQTDRIGHISRVLYHSGTALTAGHKQESMKEALRAALTRRSEEAVVSDGPELGTYHVRRGIRGSPLVSIIIPSRDQVALLRNCIDSVEKLTTYSHYEIIIMDNGTEDPESLSYLEQLPHAVVVDSAPFNFARLCNGSVAHAAGDHLLFLNNDVEVITPDWLEALVEHSQRTGVGAVGAQLLYPDSTLQHAGVTLGVAGVASHAFKYQPSDHLGYYALPHLVRNCSAVTAACAMVPKAVYEEIGGMRQELAVTFNDVDLCLRLQQHGYRIIYTPHARLYHYESKSRWLLPPRHEEKEYMIEHWAAAIENDRFYNKHLTRDWEDFSFDARRAAEWVRETGARGKP